MINKEKLREGFTTGTAAAAAAVANVLRAKPAEKVPVMLPGGLLLHLSAAVREGKTGIYKDAGDDPDVTDGLFIYADVTFREDGMIRIHGGQGVGVVTKPGLSVAVGEAAINPVPRRMIADNLRAFLPVDRGADVTVHVPEGERVAEKTFNRRLGIEGGISILGTTGIVRPMDSAAMVQSMRCEIDVLRAEGRDFIWLVPGRIGEKALLQMIPSAAVAMMGNFAGEALRYSTAKGYESVGLAGHPGKLAKIAMGYGDTHSGRSPQATRYVRNLLGIAGEINTVEEICQPEYAQGFRHLAKKISLSAVKNYHFKKVKTVLFSMKGELLGTYG